MAKSDIKVGLHWAKHKTFGWAVARRTETQWFFNGMASSDNDIVEYHENTITKEDTAMYKQIIGKYQEASEGLLSILKGFMKDHNITDFASNITTIEDALANLKAVI